MLEETNKIGVVLGDTKGIIVCDPMKDGCPALDKRQADVREQQAIIAQTLRQHTDDTAAMLRTQTASTAIALRSHTEAVATALREDTSVAFQRVYDKLDEISTRLLLGMAGLVLFLAGVIVTLAMAMGRK